jgi:two-component system, OmpR family, sensor kinase
MSARDHAYEPTLAESSAGPPLDGRLAAPALPSALTPQQRQVAQLIARGFSDEEIAHELALSNATVANHVAAILRRLGLGSRAQVASWATAHGLDGTQDRVLLTLERLLEIQPTGLKHAMTEVASLIADVLRTDKVDAFLHEQETDTLVAVGASNTPMARQQHAIGLDRQQLANGGRAVEVFQTGQPHWDGRVDKDPEELIGVKRGLKVRSQIGVTLDVAGTRRGVLTAQSAQPDFFSERDLHFLQAVSRWVGSVAHRAELAEQTAAAALEQGRRLAAEELVTVLAHDLRNHLTPLRARAQILSRRAVREQHAPNLQDATKLDEGIERLGRLISDLLDLARLDQGLFTVNPQPLDVAALVREIAEAMSAPGAAVRVEAPPELPIVADPVRLRQVLENLLANAVAHSPDGIAVGFEVAAEQRPGQTWAVITVADQGPGIPADLPPRLFERFAKAPGSAGLGLGLHLAQQIALAHGGTLEVASTPGQARPFACRCRPRAAHGSRSGRVSTSPNSSAVATALIGIGRAPASPRSHSRSGRSEAGPRQRTLAAHTPFSPDRRHSFTGWQGVHAEPRHPVAASLPSLFLDRAWAGVSWSC